MKRALVLQHMDHDHPGCFADLFAEDGIVPDFVRLFEGEEIPKLDQHDLLFVLGGAQDAWEEDKFPWLTAEKQAIREWVWDRAKPYIGICLGHQLLADALGGKVERANGSEVGVFDVQLTDDGNQHPFFKGLDQSQRVMQWHFAEVSQAPQSARVLASSSVSPIQAMAVDDHALGTQFHCEFTPQSVAGWSSMPNYVGALETHHGAGAYRRLLEESYPMLPTMNRMTRRIWNNFKLASGLMR
jgi:GMP synthase-like glutamine amidotransferase